MKHLRLAAGVAAAPLALTGCGLVTTTSHVESHTGPVRVVKEIPISPRSYARGLLAMVQVPAGATVVTRPPAQTLAKLHVFPATYKDPLTLTRWWTVDEPASVVYAWLKAHQTGFGTPDGGSHPSWLAFEQKQASLPASIGVGDVFFEVAPAGAGTTGIAAFALTLAQLPRPQAEIVPTGVVRALVRWQLADGTWASKTLAGAAAAKLAGDFDRLRLSMIGTPPCASPIPNGAVTVSFTAAGHTWRAGVQSCPGIDVARDGVALPYLAPGNPFSADVAAITGH